MALIDINVSALRGSLNACLNSIDNSYTTDIVSNLSGDTVWSGAAKDNLKTALETLSTTRYDDLKSKIEEYLSIADTIEEYQNLYNEISDLESNLSTKKSSLYYAENNQSEKTNYSENLTKEINTLQADINSKKVTLENIENSLIID